MKGLLKNREYLILMMAQGISSIGDWLSMVAIITLVGLKWNASPMEVSFIILCLALPMALLGPVAGTLADRVNRKSLMMISDLVRAGLILVLTIANTIGVVYICLFTIGVFSAVFVPAKNGKLKELVAEEDLKAAMSVTSMIDSSTKIIGPLLSGIFVTAFGAQTVFYLDSLTFLASALLIMALPKTLSGSKDSTQLSPANNYSFKKDFILGISYMKSNKYLLVGLFFLGVSLLILQLSDSQIIVLLRELTHSSPDLFGYIVAASGIGMFLSGMFLTKKTNYPSYPLMLLGVCGIGFSFGIMAVFTHFDYHGSIIWAPFLGLLAGFSASFVFIPFQATLQLDTPVHMTGRVFGVVNSVTTTATIIGPLLGGWIATEFGIIPTFILTASLLLVLSVIGFLVKSKVERGKVDVSKGQPGTLETTKG